MQPEIKRAWIQGGVRLGVGATLVLALIGVRIVTVRSASEEPEAGTRDATEAQRVAGLPSESASRSAAAPVDASTAARTEVAQPQSLIERLSASVGDRMPDSAPKGHEGDALVSCRLDEGSRFMRAADCAMRGGRATLLGDGR
jgi:hypothetical protein